MRLDQSVTVPVRAGDVWRFLGDIPAVAACMPGAQITRTVDDATYEGTVKVAIGPLAMNYAGVVTIEERDEHGQRIVLLASGRDRRGSGTARAHVTVHLVPGSEHTDIKVGSDLQLTGRLAALGRGVNDVSARLFTEFAEHLTARLEAPATPSPAPAAAAEPGSAPGSAPAPAAAPGSRTPQAAPATPAAPVAPDGAPLQVWPLLVAVTRERLAAFLVRLSERVKP